MGNYKIRVNIEIVESDEAISSGPEAIETGMFEFNISSEAATSIDACEQALLRTNYPALRSALAHHLETLSQKKRPRHQPPGFGK
ncbi:MAG: hypothetical protein F6K31_43425 [Symploca sp. SIO2G7]|nr:hypothetical protein [Symploca sp. SIO2G7]